MYRDIQEHKMYLAHFDVVHVRNRRRVSTTFGLICLTIMVILFINAAQAMAQEKEQLLLSQSGEHELYDSFHKASVSEDVQIGVTVLENLSIQIENGFPIVKTNFKWGASLTKEQKIDNTIVYWVSVHYWYHTIDTTP